MVEFFIRRPIFSTVVSLVVILAGLVSMGILPIAQFPDITPPTITVSSNYPGADAVTVSDVVTRPLEQQINGVKGMIYMSSASTNNGDSSITVTFDVGYDQDIAAVDVQNRVERAKPRLPDEVQRSGVVVDKQSTSLTMVVSLLSPERTFDGGYLTNYADIHVTDALTRVPGVGKINNFGLRKYAIRIWLDPERMATMDVGIQEIRAAVGGQNKQAVAGKVAAPPTVGDPAFTLQVTTMGRLQTVEEFENIVIRATGAGRVVRLKDVAKVELGSQTYTGDSRQNGMPAAQIGVYQLPDANALDVAQKITEAMDQLSEQFPEDMTYKVTYDSTSFVQASIEDLVTTIIEAAILVILVIYIFLQSVRTTVIPLLAIPVSVVGAFAAMLAFGFSINTLTLLGLVLAIGLVVDDAIVVVENVEREIRTGPKDRTPMQSTIVAMKQVTGPVVATTLVLLAVFIPAAMMPGITGQLYNQFALTIAFSVLISSVVSLTLSPALCALMMKREDEEDRKPSLRERIFSPFNRFVDWITKWYGKLVHLGAKIWLVIVLIFSGVVVGLVLLLIRTPSDFVPNEDQGYFFVTIQLPSASTMDRTQDVEDIVLKMIDSEPEVVDVIMISGYNFLSGISQTNSAFFVVTLKNWSERPAEDQHVEAIIERLMPRFMSLPQAIVMAFNPPAITGLGAVGGFQMQVQDVNSLGIDAMSTAVRTLIGASMKTPYIGRLSTTFRNDVPQLFLDIDRTKAELYGVDVGTLLDTLQFYMGSFYINDFNKYGKVYQVIAQADAEYRMTPDEILALHVQNRDGSMIPLSAFVKVESTSGVDNLAHYNIYDSVSLNGTPGAGFSSGIAIKAMETIADRFLPAGMTTEWTGMTYQQLKAGNLAPLIFALALIVVFLFLAAQYESWTLPILILLAVPPAVLGALLFLLFRTMPLDVYGQIGLVMLIGLAAKNSILIVEFAKQEREAGGGIVESAVKASILRLRPILMTAVSFAVGVIPLVVATGAGAVSRQSLGTVVFGGMVLATVLTLILVPIFYVILETIRTKFGFHKVATPEAESTD
ncbi:MAG: multidrug efflux RND transporter permease subunit [Phycisphaerales bacterium]|nr:multidrug efflux RND transporter permease subunit [Phycisphaerales bacterium]